MGSGRGASGSQKRKALAMWDGGDVGGFDCLVRKEEGAEAAEVYRVDDDSPGVTTIQPVSNALVLVLRDAQTMRFVKYVSADAPGSRWDVAAEYRLAKTTVSSG